MCGKSEFGAKEEEEEGIPSYAHADRTKLKSVGRLQPVSHPTPRKKRKKNIFLAAALLHMPYIFGRSVGRRLL